MKLDRTYEHVHFDADVVSAAIKAFASEAESESVVLDRTVSVGADQWSFDTDEEFLDAYRQGFESVRYQMHNRNSVGGWAEAFTFNAHKYRWSDGPNASVRVEATTRAAIHAVTQVFDSKVAESTVNPPPAPPKPPAPKPVVFIGHGHSAQWRDLKDHLHDRHQYDVEAYEVGARAGHAVRDVLASMMKRSSFAVLVMTAEDEQADGGFHPRLNVVHETGLFQGGLGWARAVVLLEEGCSDFSNIGGIEQIRYPAGGIRETFGDVVATLRREFESKG